MRQRRHPQRQRTAQEPAPHKQLPNKALGITLFLAVGLWGCTPTVVRTDPRPQPPKPADVAQSHLNACMANVKKHASTHHCAQHNDCKAGMEQAQQDCRKAMDLDPHLTQALRGLGRAQEALGHRKDAIRSYRQYLKQKPDQVAVRARMARLQIQVGRYKDALPFYRMMYATRGQKPGLTRTLLMLYRKTLQFQVAERLARQMLATNARNKEVYSELILLYASWGKYNQALLAGHVALKALKFNDASLLNNMGTVYLKKGQPQNARRMFQQAVKQDPSHLQARMNLGTMAMERGAFKQALTHWKAVLEKNPHHEQASRQYAAALMGTRQYKKAHPVYASLLDKNPNDPEALFQLGVIYFKASAFRKRQKESGLLFERFLNNQEARKMKQYNRAKAFIQQARQRLKVLRAMKKPTSRR